MAKVIFEFTESVVAPTDKPGYMVIPVNISVGIEGFNGGQPGHSECLALIMKQKASAIINAINGVYIRKLKESGVQEVKSELFKVNESQGDKNVH